MPDDASRPGDREPSADADEPSRNQGEPDDTASTGDRGAVVGDRGPAAENPEDAGEREPTAEEAADGEAAGEQETAADRPTEGRAPDDGGAETAERSPDRSPPSEDGSGGSGSSEASASVPADVRKYDRFKKMDGAQYERVNEFLRDRTHITAREWAIARLCADFRTETGVEMTKIGENLPRLVPFMTDEYSPQAVNQARSSFESKVRKAGATFLYGAMCEFLTADELDDLMYEATEVAKFLLEVEGVELTVEEELEAEDRISSVMREVRRSSDELRHEGVECPHCGSTFEPEGTDADADAESGEPADEVADGAH